MLSILLLLLLPCSTAFSPSLCYSRGRGIRLSVSSPEVMEMPLLFDDGLLDDMQMALLAMEKRVQEGPYSLSKQEVIDLEARLQRIVKDMRGNAHLRPQKPDPQQEEPAPAEIISNTPIMDTSNDEGPVYDGKGGMGQPRGTINTYIIEGMDEMTSDEYRDALQQSIIDRQKQRRESGAALGARGTADYFSSLGGQGGMFRSGQ